METSYLDLTIRLAFAFALGGAIGIEREYRAKEAGFRTHFLVALGSALFCVVSQHRWCRASASWVLVPLSFRKMWCEASPRRPDFG